VRQRLDKGAVYREVGVKQVCEPDALGFGSDPERVTITVEAEGAAGLHLFLGILQSSIRLKAILQEGPLSSGQTNPLGLFGNPFSGRR
jgi:hypothetical protein